MCKAERLSVQRHSLANPARVLAAAGAVSGVAQHGMAKLGQVDTNLISSSGFQMHFQQRRIGKSLCDFIVCDRQFGFW